MMIGAWWAWLVALALYGAFRLWYDSRRGPLTQPEIDAFMAKVAQMRVQQYTDPAVVPAFLEADDGQEFVMSHLLPVHPRQCPHSLNAAPSPCPGLFHPGNVTRGP